MYCVFCFWKEAKKDMSHGIKSKESVKSLIVCLLSSSIPFGRLFCDRQYEHSLSFCWSISTRDKTTMSLAHSIIPLHVL